MGIRQGPDFPEKGGEKDRTVSPIFPRLLRQQPFGTGDKEAGKTPGVEAAEGEEGVFLGAAEFQPGDNVNDLQGRRRSLRAVSRPWKSASSMEEYSQAP